MVEIRRSHNPIALRDHRSPPSRAPPPLRSPRPRAPAPSRPRAPAGLRSAGVPPRSRGRALPRGPAGPAFPAAPAAHAVPARRSSPRPAVSVSPRGPRSRLLPLTVPGNDPTPADAAPASDPA
ncbi:hypothetical protein GCM10009741_69230 [Kribbella lupini]|uniref:Uncharacterized protein n=1 Tax=Kribbella lupini TaxID=291602 RepID=A0ABN2CAS8_9ACTN